MTRRLSFNLVLVLAMVFLTGLGGYLSAEKNDGKPEAKTPLIFSLPATGNPSFICPALQKRVDINVENVPFQKLIEDFFIKKYGLNIVVDWSDLEEVYSDARHTKITLSWKDVTLGQALRGVLELGNADKLSLGYYTDEDSVIYVQEMDAGDGKMITRYYDCGELLRVSPPSPSRSLKRVTQKPGSYSPTPTSSSGASAFDSDGPEDREDDLMSTGTVDDGLWWSKDRLAGLIRAMVDKESWDYNGGTAQLEFYGRTMVVQATAKNQQAILTLLERFRTAQLQERQVTPLVLEAWWAPADSNALTDAKVDISQPFSEKITAEMLNAIPQVGYGIARGYNTEPMTLMNGTGHMLLTDVSAEVSEDAAINAPIISNVFFGTSLEVTATLSKSARQASITVDSEVSALRELQVKPVKDAENSPAGITQPQYTLGGLRADVVIPVGRPVLLGGYKHRNLKDEKAQAAAPMLLFVQVSQASLPESSAPAVQSDLAKAGDKAPAAAQPETPEEKLQAMLKKRVDFTVDDMSLTDIFQNQFPKQFGVNVFVNWRKLEFERRNLRNKKISVSLKDLPFSKVLDIILRLGGGSDIDLGYLVNPNGMLSIEMRNELERMLVTRLYPCGGLLLISNRASGNDLVWPSEMMESFRYADRGPWGDDEDQDSEDDRLSNAQNYLENLLTNIIDKESWDRNGGLAQMAFRGKTLVVKNGQPQQRALESVLENLRSMQAYGSTRQAVSVRAWWVSADAKTLASLVKQGDKLTAAALEALTPEYKAMAVGINRRTMVLQDGEGKKLTLSAETSVSKTKAMYSPMVENVFFGAGMYITPRLDPAGRTAEITLYSQASALKDVRKRPLLVDGKPASFELTLPDYVLREMNTHTTIPVGRPVLIGGFASSETKTEAEKTAGPLLLFLQIDAPKE